MGLGRKTTTSNNRVNINNGIEYFWRTEIGVFRIIKPEHKPITMKRVCFAKKV